MYVFPYGFSAGLSETQVSGDGKLQTAAQAPNSGLDTSFDSLELYLISASQKMNLTIMSNGSGFLQQEPGSTVKHLDFQLSNCVPEGEYNVRSSSHMVLKQH